MVTKNDDTGKPLEPRPPTVDDFLELCRHLNAERVAYMVIGGMAMIQKGFVRATEDIDLFVDGSPDNVTKIKRALAFLPDNAVKDVGVNDLIDYVVVRVADEIVIDLMRSACGVEYSEVKDEIEKVTIKDVEIPFARARLLLRLKQTLRSKDEMDRQFLQNLMEEEKA